MLQDISTSIQGRVARLDPDELQPLLDYAEAHGGTVAFGTFGVLARPLVRAVFDAPLQPRSQRVNVFLRTRQSTEEQDGLQQDYLSRSAAERERFLEQVGLLLQEAANSTNLVAALERAQVYFAEAKPGSATALLVVSDLQDTTGADSFDLALDPAVRLLIVTHSRDLGILQAQTDRVEMFESDSAALRAALPGTP